MQKLPFYLLPNRLSVTTDLVNNGYSTERRQVYQRKLNLYKGIDNNIELDVRGGDQQRQPVVEYTANIRFFDAQRKLLFTATATPILSKTGIMQFTVTAETLANIKPQQLSFAASLVDNLGNETILYSDAQFGVPTFAEILEGYDAAPDLIDTVNTWIYDMGSKDLVSEIVDFGTKLNNDLGQTDIAGSNIIVTPNFTNPYLGTITIEVTDDKSLALGNRWQVLGTIDSNEFDGKRFTGNWRFMRFRYPKWIDSITQKETTGLVDKISVIN